MTAALKHPEMVAGLARRGLTPGDVFCLPLTAGNYLTPEYEGTRLMKVPCYLNPTGSNYYAKPVEGLFAVVDLLRSEATGVVDEGIVPLPEDDWGYTPDEIAARRPLRPASSPVHLTQAGGPGYAVTGSRIEWDIWRFRLRVDKRPGIVLSNIDVRDGERWRPVLYQAHLSEVFVPYMDPAAGWYFRTYMDSGEYGFGLFLTPLTVGVDCPAHATFLPALVNDDQGRPLEIPNAICVFERYIGDPAWRHFEVFAQGEATFVPAEGRPDTELVVRSASVVGNYDYLLDYRLRQNGENPHQDRCDRPGLGQGRRLHLDAGCDGGRRHRPRDPGGAQPRGAVPRSLLQLPPGLRRRRPDQSPCRPGGGGRRAGGGQSAPLVLDGRTLQPGLRTGGALHAERDGAEVLPGRERGGAHAAGPPPRLHDPSRQRRLRSVRLRRRPADEAQRLYRAHNLEHRPRPGPALCRRRVPDAERRLGHASQVGQSGSAVARYGRRHVVHRRVPPPPARRKLAGDVDRLEDHSHHAAQLFHPQPRADDSAASLIGRTPREAIRSEGRDESPMNSDMMRRVADAIELYSEKYNQESYGNCRLTLDNRTNDCRSACCIAGFAVALDCADKGVPVDLAMNQLRIHACAQEILGLSRKEATLLFSSSWPVAWLDWIIFDTDPECVIDDTFVPNAEHAVLTLQGMAKSGHVWEEADSYEEAE